MNRSAKIVVSVLAMVSIGVADGCALHLSAAYKLEDHFTRIGNVIVEHNQYFVGPGLKHGESRKQAADAITRYLRGDSSVTANEPPFMPDDDGLSRRDYWALVLAGFTGDELHFCRGDSGAEREAQIQRMLNGIGTRPLE